MVEATSRIVKAIRAVPKGNVSCYRDIAATAGLPNGARQVARVLHSMSDKHHLPWHRIIRADGFIALGIGQGGDLQAELLRAEGVEVSKTNWVDLSRYGYRRVACGIAPKGAKTARASCPAASRSRRSGKPTLL